VTGARNGRRGLPGLVLWLTVTGLSKHVLKMNDLRIQAFLKGQLARLRGLGWSEVMLLVATLVVLGCGYGFIELADKVMEGVTQSIDERLLRSLRRADDPAMRCCSW
jgi:hypothetical protein